MMPPMSDVEAFAGCPDDRYAGSSGHAPALGGRSQIYAWLLPKVCMIKALSRWFGVAEQKDLVVS